MNMKQLRLWAFGALGLCTAGAVAARESNETALRDAVPRIERLALFKNGLGYARATVKLPDNATTVRRGITWVPSYRIDLSDEKTAHFFAQAQIINELADIQDAHVDLVTGFPNIQFPELPNPVAMSQNLAEFLRSLATGRAEGGERGSMMQQQALAFNSNYAPYDNALLP